MSLIGKSLSFFALAAFMGSLVMVGCSPAKEGDSTSSTGSAGAAAKPAYKIGIVFDSGGRGDKSFNDSAWAGIERAKGEFTIEEKPIESKTEKDYEANLTALAEQNCDLIFAIGINMKASLEKVAPNFPDVKFAIVDAVVDSPNVRSLLFKEEEGSYLVGYLAGLMTKSNKLGFIGGMELDLIHKFYSGYAAGAKSANPNITVLPDKYTGSWDNPDTAKVAANLLFDQGADVIYHAAGRAGLGVITAAKEKGKFAIGVDSDQDYLAEGTVLTSMIKRVDEAVYKTIADLNSQKFSSGVTVYDLAAGGVGISELKFTKDLIGQEKLDKVMQEADKIKNGTIKVPATKADLATFKPSK